MRFRLRLGLSSSLIPHLGLLLSEDLFLESEAYIYCRLNAKCCILCLEFGFWVLAWVWVTGAYLHHFSWLHVEFRVIFFSDTELMWWQIFSRKFATGGISVKLVQYLLTVLLKWVVARHDDPQTWLQREILLVSVQVITVPDISGGVALGYNKWRNNARMSCLFVPVLSQGVMSEGSAKK